MATATAMEKTTSRRPRIRTLTTRTLESIRPSDTPEVFEAIFLAMKPVYHFLEVPRVILFGLESLVYRTLPSTLELYKTRLLESREYPVAVDSDPCAVAVNLVTNRIYVPNYYSDNVTVIDGAT